MFHFPHSPPARPLCLRSRRALRSRIARAERVLIRSPWHVGPCLTLSFPTLAKATPNCRPLFHTPSEPNPLVHTPPLLLDDLYLETSHASPGRIAPQCPGLSGWIAISGRKMGNSPCLNPNSPLSRTMFPFHSTANTTSHPNPLPRSDVKMI